MLNGCCQFIEIIKLKKKNQKRKTKRAPAMMKSNHESMFILQVIAFYHNLEYNCFTFYFSFSVGSLLCRVICQVIGGTNSDRTDTHGTINAINNFF